jgi:HD-GYP domain-containing protein (c-di-GMP phosphodiesterase class II)
MVLTPHNPEAADRLGRVEFAIAETGIGSTGGLWLLMTTLFRHQPDRLGHAQRVARMARAIAAHLGCQEPDVDLIERAALAHEIGSVVVPDLPAGQAHEEAAVRGRAAEQATTGATAIARSPFLAPSARLLRAMPEWIDGTGQPLGIAGDRIPRGARILSVADVFDVMDSTCQQLGWPRDLAAVELVRYAGRRFDADVVAAALRVVEAVPAERQAPMTGAPQVV